MHEVSGGWRSVRLKDAGTWLSGGTPFTDDPRYWCGDIPWISAASLKDFRISRSDRCVTELGTLSGTRLVPPGTVLFVVRGMSLKSEFRVGITERHVAFGQDCKAIIPAAGTDARFLARALQARSRDILAMVDEAGHGTGRLPTDLISKLAIRIPELSEQRRITEIVDSMDELIYYSKRLLQKELMLQKAMLASLLTTKEINATMATVLEESPKNGLYKPLSDYGNDGIPIVRIDSIQDGEVDAIETLRRVRISGPEGRMFGVQPHDILINRVNTADLVGKSAIVREVPESVVFESNIMRCRIKENVAKAHYIALYGCAA